MGCRFWSMAYPMRYSGFRVWGSGFRDYGVRITFAGEGPVVEVVRGGGWRPQGPSHTLTHSLTHTTHTLWGEGLGVQGLPIEVLSESTAPDKRFMAQGVSLGLWVWETGFRNLGFSDWSFVFRVSDKTRRRRTGLQPGGTRPERERERASEREREKQIERESVCV